MRIFLAALAFAGLVVCSYQLLSIPKYGQSVVTMLSYAANETLRYYAAGAVISAVVLFLVAIKRSRLITEERRLGNIETFIDEELPFLEQMERRHGRAQTMYQGLVDADSRVRVLTDKSTGFKATLRRLQDEFPTIKERVDELTVNSDGDNVMTVAEQLISDYDEALRRLDKLTTLSPRILEMAANIESMTQTVKALEDGKDGLHARMRALLEALDELLDANDDGRIANIENGASGIDGDLDDQLQYMRERAAEIIKRLKGLQKTRREIDEVSASLVQIGAVAATSNVVPGPGHAAAS